VCRCFPPGGSHQRVKLVCVLPFLDGDAERHKDLSWFGQEKALRPAGGSVCIILHLSACTGVKYKSGMNCGGVRLLCYVWLVCSSAPGPPLLYFQGEAQGTCIGDRVGVDRGMARGPTRGLRTGVASSRLVLVL